MYICDVSPPGARSLGTNLERTSVDGALLVIVVKSERHVPGSFRYLRGNEEVTDVGFVRPDLRGRRRTRYPRG
jgi:hypothetical protein